jgi:hypothetical protein
VSSVGELAWFEGAGLVGADGPDVGPGAAEGERVTNPAAEVVGQLVILAKLAGRLVWLDVHGAFSYFALVRQKAYGTSLFVRSDSLGQLLTPCR